MFCIMWDPHKFTINLSNFEANIFEMNIILTMLISKEFTLTTPSYRTLQNRRKFTGTLRRSSFHNSFCMSCPSDPLNNLDVIRKILDIPHTLPI